MESGRAAAPNEVRSKSSGRWMLAGATFFWGTSATLARMMFRDLKVPALTVVELRLLIACAILGPWLAIASPRSLRVKREDWGYFLILGLIGVATVQGSYYYSISVLGVGLSILLQYVAPSLIVLYEVASGRHVHATTLLAVGGALIGTALLVGQALSSGIHAQPWQWAIGFSSAVWFAFYIVYSKRGLERYAPETVLFYTFLIAGLTWAFVTPPIRILQAGYGARTWALFLAMGIFSTLVPFRLFYAGLSRMRPTEAGIVATLEPVIASASAALVLNEGLRPLQWLGAALVLTAAVLAPREMRAEFEQRSV